MPAVFHRLEDRQSVSQDGRKQKKKKQKKPYKPVMTTAPILLIFVVIAVACVILLQNIVESGTPLHDRYDEDSQKQQRLKREGRIPPSEPSLTLLPRQAGSSTSAATTSPAAPSSTSAFFTTTTGTIPDVEAEGDTSSSTTTSTIPDVEGEGDNFSSTTTSTIPDVEADPFSSTTTTTSSEIEIDTFYSTTTTTSFEVDVDTFSSTTTTSSSDDEDNSTSPPSSTLSTTTTHSTLTTPSSTPTSTTISFIITTTIVTTTSPPTTTFTTTFFSSTSTNSTTTSELTTTSSASVPDPELVCNLEVDAYYIDSAETLVTTLSGSERQLDLATCLDFCVNNMDSGACQSVIFEDPENKCYFFMDTFQDFNLGGFYNPEERTDPDNHYYFSDAACLNGTLSDPVTSTTQSSTTFTTNATTTTTITSSLNTTTTSFTTNTTTSTSTSTNTTTTFTTSSNTTTTTSNSLTTTTLTPTTTTTTTNFTTTSTTSTPTTTSTFNTTSTLTTSRLTTTSPLTTSTLTTTSNLTTSTLTPTTTTTTSTVSLSTSPSFTSSSTLTTSPPTLTTTTTVIIDVVDDPPTSSTTTSDPVTTQSVSTSTTSPAATSSTTSATSSPETLTPTESVTTSASIDPETSETTSTSGPTSTSDPVAIPNTDSSTETTASATVSDVAENPGLSTTPSQSSSQTDVTAADDPTSAASQPSDTVSNSVQDTTNTILSNTGEGASATQAAQTSLSTASTSQSDSAGAAAVPTQAATATQATDTTPSTATQSDSAAAAAIPTQASQDSATVGNTGQSQQTGPATAQSTNPTAAQASNSATTQPADPTVAQASNPATAVPVSNAATQTQATNSVTQTLGVSASDPNSLSGQSLATNSLSGSNTLATATQPTATGSVSIVAVALSNDPTAIATASISGSTSGTNGTGSGSGSDGSGAGGGGGGGGGSGAGGDSMHPITDSSPFILTLPVPITDTTMYAAIFVTVTMSVLFKSFWCVVFASAKMMEPFYQLSMGATMVTAEASVLRQYLQAGIEWRDLNPKNKHWVMFLTTIVNILLSVQASIASEAMTVQAGATCDTHNGTKLCDPVWVINYAVIRGLQTTLCIAAVAITILIYLNWNRPSALFSYPCSLASMASLLSNSEEQVVEILRNVHPDAKEWAVKKVMKGKSFTFRRTHVRADSDILGVSVQVDEVQSVEQLTPPATTSRSMGDGVDVAGLASGAHIPSSWLDRLPWGKGYITVITLLHMALFGVILSFVLSGNDIYAVNLIGNDGKQHLTAVRWQFLDGTKFGPRFFMTLLVSFLFTPFWEQFELAVRVMVPYRRLQKGNKEGRHLLTMYLHGVPFTTFFKALRHKNWYHAFIAFTTVLSYLLLILIAGVPYNYGQIKNVSFYSSLVSVVILGFMLVAMVSLIFWQMGNPRMQRKPDTLINTWLLMCASGFVDELKGRPLHEIRDDLDSGNGRFWFRKARGVDGVQRWMVDAEGEDNWQIRRQASAHLLDQTSKPEQNRYFSF